MLGARSAKETRTLPGPTTRGIPAPQECEPRPNDRVASGLRPSAARQDTRGPEASSCWRPQLFTAGETAIGLSPRPGLGLAAENRSWTTARGPGSRAPAQVSPTGRGPRGTRADAARSERGERADPAHARYVRRVPSEVAGVPRRVIVRSRRCL